MSTFIASHPVLKPTRWEVAVVLMILAAGVLPFLAPVGFAVTAWTTSKPCTEDGIPCASAFLASPFAHELSLIVVRSILVACFATLWALFVTQWLLGHSARARTAIAVGYIAPLFLPPAIRAFALKVFLDLLPPLPLDRIVAPLERWFQYGALADFGLQSFAITLAVLPIATFALTLKLPAPDSHTLASVRELRLSPARLLHYVYLRRGGWRLLMTSLGLCFAVSLSSSSEVLYLGKSAVTLDKVATALTSAFPEYVQFVAGSTVVLLLLLGAIAAAPGVGLVPRFKSTLLSFTVLDPLWSAGSWMVHLVQVALSPFLRVLAPAGAITGLVLLWIPILTSLTLSVWDVTRSRPTAQHFLALSDLGSLDEALAASFFMSLSGGALAIGAGLLMARLASVTLAGRLVLLLSVVFFVIPADLHGLLLQRFFRQTVNITGVGTAAIVAGMAFMPLAGALFLIALRSMARTRIEATQEIVGSAPQVRKLAVYRPMRAVIVSLALTAFVVIWNDNQRTHYVLGSTKSIGRLVSAELAAGLRTGAQPSLALAGIQALAFVGSALGVLPVLLREISGA